MVHYYTIAKNGQKYYYNNGKRISAEEGKRLGARKKSEKNGSRKKSSRKSKSLVPCKPHQIRDLTTNRCRNRSTKLQHKTSKKKSSSRKSKKSLVPCKPHQIRDPTTNRCINRSTKLQPKTYKKKSNKSKVPCKSHQVRDSKTGRCKNKSSYKGKRSLVRNPVDRVLKSKRWAHQKKNQGDCVKRSKLPLRDLQLKVVEYMATHDSLLVVHSTGCGKTLTAIACSQCYLDKYPDRDVVFVGPASLISNFKKEMKAYGVENFENYEFYSYDKFMLEDKAGRPINLKNKMLIVDEAHNLRNPKSKKSQAVVNAAIKADKRLLLTATPFVNSMTDFIPLINIIYGKIIVGTRKQFYSKESDEWLGKEINETNLTTFRYLLEDKVDMVDCKDPIDFPERVDHFVDVPMSKDYYNRYVKLVRGENIFGIFFEKPQAFYNGYRRAVNRAGPEYYSTKINAALPILTKGRSIIYTNWIDFGIRPITDALNKEGITYKIFTGEVPVVDRQKIVDDFNTGKFNVLILTKAGGEGIDLKGVQSVIVLDPPWNDAGLQQVIGRAIRYKSHFHLTQSKRKVNVYFMALVKPTSVTSADAEASGDKLLYSIIEKKKEISTVLLALLKQLSI